MSDKLPKWVEEWDSEDGSPKIKEALSIAWEVMAEISNESNVTGHHDIRSAKAWDGMRRIEEVGK
jgi:hypothetical protein